MFREKSSSFKQIGHPDRSEAQGPAVSFSSSDLTALNKSRHPPLCHPERTRIFYFAALPAATYAALRKESRMKSTEVTVLTGNLGAAEGSAVRPGSRTKISVPLVLPQTCHPEAKRLADLSLNTGLTARSRRACPERSRRGPAVLLGPHAIAHN
jgi:hypothetical protein